jgi:ribonuclease P protein component
MAVDVEGGGPAGRGYRLPREARITTSAQIRALFRRGKRRRTRHLDAFFSASPAPFPRLGLVVPKPRQKKTKQSRRIGGAAVRRNRLKRRLRELGRTRVLPRLQEAGRPLDLLIRARPEAYGADFATLRQELQQLVEELCSQGS